MGNQAYGSFAISGEALESFPAFFLINNANIGIFGDSQPRTSPPLETVSAPFKGTPGFQEPKNNGAQVGIGRPLTGGQSSQGKNFNGHFHTPHLSNKIVAFTRDVSFNSSCGDETEPTQKDKPKEALTPLGFSSTAFQTQTKEQLTTMLSQHAHTGVFPCKVFSPNHANNKCLSIVDSGSTSNPAVVNASLYFGDEWCEECAGQSGSEYAVESWDGAFFSETVCGGCNGTGLSLLGRISEGLEQVPVWPFPFIEVEGGMA